MRDYNNFFRLTDTDGFSYRAAWENGKPIFSWTHPGPVDFNVNKQDTALAALFGGSYEDWTRKVGEAVAEKESFSWIHSLHLPDGTARNVCHILSPDGEGAASGLLVLIDESIFDRLGYLEYLPVGVYLVDCDYRIQWTNELGTRQSHINWKQNYGQLCYAHPFGLGTPCEDCPVSRTLADGGHHSGIRDMPNGDTWLISSVPAHDRQGNRKGAIEVVVDITEASRERSLAVAELQKKERRLTHQMTAIQHVHVFYTNEGNNVLDNPGVISRAAAELLQAAAARLFVRSGEGYTCISHYDARTGQHWMVQATFSDDLLRFFREATAEEKQLAISDVRTAGFPADLLAYCNNENIQAILLTPIRMGREILGFLSVADCSPREWLSEDKAFMMSLTDFMALCISRSRLEEQQAKMDNLMANLPGVAFKMRYGPDGAAFEYLSDSCRRYLGFSMEEAVREPDILRRILSEDDFQNFHDAHMEQRGPGETLELMFRVVLDGNTRWILEKSRVIEAASSGGEQTFEGFVHDITERMQLREAELASEAKSNFLATMSHEIRTPLNAITGFLHLLGKSGMTAEQAEYASKIGTAASSLLEVINAVLDFSKIEAGKMSIVEEPFNPEELVGGIESMFCQLAADKGLSLDVSVEQDVPRNLSGDARHIRQALINLVGNAVKFTFAGGVSVGCSLASLTENEAYLKFSVSDTGIGMSKDFLDRIFTPFEQGDGSVSRQHGGTGLGLSIAKSLAELMHGKMEVRSEEGKGSSFSFTCRAEVLRGRSAAASQASREVPKFLDCEILLVEDNEINREIALALLSDTGLRVHEAENGAEALKIVSDSAPSRFSLILMDIQMPVMDGLQATRKIRKLPGMDSVPIIAMTAHALDVEIDKCLNAGMNAHVSKPLDIWNFYSVLSDSIPDLLRR